MKMKNAAVTLIFTGFLLISSDVGLGNQALAQGGSGGLTEEQRREMEQKYQEQWQELERENKETTESGSKRPNSTDGTRNGGDGRRRSACGNYSRIRANNYPWL